ncbi:hypothetical protein N0V90_004641 [Kalmusia sp. IMI 367209]|nr:hypothetical protein N0V90_004641 [Kalmusia sp. IMI 367209]
MEHESDAIANSPSNLDSIQKAIQPQTHPVPVASDQEILTHNDNILTPNTHTEHEISTLFKGLESIDYTQPTLAPKSSLVPAAHAFQISAPNINLGYKPGTMDTHSCYLIVKPDLSLRQIFRKWLITRRCRRAFPQKPSNIDVEICFLERVDEHGKSRDYLAYAKMNNGHMKHNDEDAIALQAVVNSLGGRNDKKLEWRDAPKGVLCIPHRWASESNAQHMRKKKLITGALRELRSVVAKAGYGCGPKPVYLRDD